MEFKQGVTFFNQSMLLTALLHAAQNPEIMCKLITQACYLLECSSVSLVEAQILIVIFMFQKQLTATEIRDSIFENYRIC